MDDKFLEFLEIAARADNKLAPEAIQSFANWIKWHEYNWQKLTATQAREYRDYLLSQELSPKKARANLKVVRDFYLWYLGVETLSPFAHVVLTVPVRKKRGPKPTKTWILSTRQVDLLRGAINRLYDTQLDFYRASLVLSLPLYMGISYSEAYDMLVDDLRGDGAYLIRDDRTIPYAAPLRTLSTQYLAARATKADPTNPYLFANGKTHYTLGSFRRILSTISNECGVRVNEKILLDTFAYNLALDGAPVGLIVTLRNCPLKRAEEFISLAAQSDDITKVYLRSVERRMRPVKRRLRVRRVD